MPFSSLSSPLAPRLASPVQLLACIWLAGVLVVAITILRQSLRLLRLSRQRLLTDPQVLNLLEDCKQQMGVSNYLAVVETEQVSGPALFGFIRPRLLLPPGLSHSLQREQLRHVLLHELAHLKRRDVLVSWIVAALQALHWFNPLVWYGFTKMRAERELACDALALSRPASPQPREYGRTIVQLLETHLAPRYQPSLAGVLEDKSQLKRRITMIAQFRNRPQVWSMPAAVLLVLLSAVALTEAQSAQPASISFTSQDLRVEPYKEGGLFQVVAAVHNNAAQPSGLYQIRFYQGDPANDKQLGPGGVGGVGPIEPGKTWNEASMPASLNEGTQTITAVLTPEGAPDSPDAKRAAVTVTVKDGKILSQQPLAAAPAQAFDYRAHDSLLNEAQRLYADWTDNHFGETVGSREYADLSPQAKAEMEPKWIAQMNGPDGEARQLAICSLGVIQSRKAVPGLLRIAIERHEKNNIDRCMAARSLGMIGDATVVPQLIPLTYHYNQNTRFWAQISLVRLTGQNFGTDWQAWANWWNGQGKQPKVAMMPVKWPCSHPEWMDPAEQQKVDAQWVENAKAKGLAGGNHASSVQGNRQALRTKYELRTRQDRQKYTRDQLIEAEELYQVANKTNLKGPEARESLQKMIQQYPDINRTGCAVLYMAQMSSGPERERLLQEAIDKHGDGVQVGAYARFLLADTCREAGQKDKAQALYDQIRKDFPDAVNHNGVSLVQLINATSPQSSATPRGAAPQDERSLANQAQQLFDRKDYAAALPMYQQLVTKFPRSREAGNGRIMLGLCYEHTGQLDQAIAAYQSAVRESPEQYRAVAYYYLGSACEQTKRTDESLAAYREALQRAEKSGRGNTFPGKDARERIAVLQASK